MSRETLEKLEKVKKYAASLRTLFQFASLVLAFAGFIGLIIILTINDSQRIPSKLQFGGAIYTGDEITLSVKIIVVVGVMISLAITLKLLHHLSMLFSHYANGEIFTSDNVRQIREIGISVFLFVAVWVYSQIANSILGSLATGSAIAEIGIAVRGWGFGLPQPQPLGVVLAGIIIIVISWIMDVGRELREEQDLTV